MRILKKLIFGNFFLKFSLLSLILFLFLVASIFGLWIRKDPWRKAFTVFLKNEPFVLARFSPKEHKFVSWSGDGKIKLFCLKNKKLFESFCINSGLPRSIRFSFDGEKIIWTTGGGAVKVFDFEKNIYYSVKFNSVIGDAFFLPTGKEILLVGKDNICRIWDIQNNREISSFRFSEDNISPDGECSISSNGLLLFFPKFMASAAIWNLENKKIKFVLRDIDSGAFFSGCFSSDSKKIITSQADGHIMIWDTETGTRLYVLKGHQFNCYSCSFSPANEKFVSVGFDNKICIWDFETKKKIWEVEESEPSGLAEFSFDGKFMLTASKNKIQIWENMLPEYWWGIFLLPEIWIFMGITLYLVVRKLMEKSTQKGAM